MSVLVTARLGLPVRNPVALERVMRTAANSWADWNLTRDDLDQLMVRLADHEPHLRLAA